ncbi:MAG: hypothetical protein ACK4FL_00560 [Microgenomates group bacterium]
MKKIIIISFFILLLGSGWLFYFRKNSKKSFYYITDSKIINNIQNNVLWYIGENKIEFHYKNPPKGQEDNTLIFTIDKDGFKDLFHRLDYNVINIEPINFKEKTLYLISNIFYQAGSYSLYYALILDLETKNVLYQTPDLIKKGAFSNLKVLKNGDVRISTLYPNYDVCRSCAFEMVDFLRYQNGKFFPVNTFYKEEFKRMYKTIKKEDSCYVVPGEKRLTFKLIKEQFGNDYQCRASEKSLPEFRGATPKEYFLLKEKIEKIINGQERRVFD